MSGYLLVPFPLHGHVNPMVAVAEELVRRGEPVTVAVSAGFAEPFAAAGCAIVELDIRARERIPEQQDLRYKLGGLRRAWDIVAERFRLTEVLGRVVEDLNPDAVVTDIMAIWGIKAAEANDVPFVSFYVTYALSEEILLSDVDRKFGPRMKTLARWSGIARIQPGLRRRVTAHAAMALVNVVSELQPMRWSFDGRFRFVGPLQRGSSVGYEGGDLPWDRIRSGPTAYVSTGTLFTRGAEYFRRVAEGFAGSGWCVVMATSHTDPAELGVLPENVVARRYVPQSEVLAHSDVFVTHAGMNSAMEGLALGIPMVLVPRAYDQRGIARQIASLGAGEIVAATAAASEFREAADRVHGDERMRATLDELSASVRGAGGAGAAVDALQKLTANR
ncbi:nucleotide disphospho-sugar-binding domain-containing protein [Saccharopolyspora sp. 6M]|uniref:nucleotide disphospho-sugar-binding domain-containing protein n=1 Tax=Saccharopolyspora sp. 6M TaxID=2877237 RepID=UPI001CD5B3CB|nr:nucleotide disphospho-sugar-binding domain-containing protein [Saccharopolyspora sp. 6M]MCA1225014.1 hypothetical protein [Saccharopolyspora sp. 6M]